MAIPHSTLKMIQRRIAAQLARMYRPSSRAFAYIEGRDIRGNAATHLRHRHVFSIDLVDFFDQINFGRVRGRLMAKPYSLSDAVATTIARLTTYNNKLPFGSPSSPILSNMICSALDAELTALGRVTGSFYTRYADDIVFSTQRRRFSAQIVKVIENEGVAQVLPSDDLDLLINRHGFQINSTKTRLKSRYDSQVICGVLVNEKLNVRRKLRREIRGMLHAWKTYGSEKFQALWVSKYNNPADKHFEPALRGKIEFLRHILGENEDSVFLAVERFNELALGSKIKYDRPLEWKETLNAKVCIVFAESSDLKAPGAKSTQGTGFVIEGGFILTNAHVVCDSNGAALDSVELRFSDLMGGSPFPAEVVSVSLARDLAVLRLADPVFEPVMKARALPLKAAAYPETGETLTLAGYPNFQDGDTLHIAEGHVTGRSTAHGVPVFRISASVIYGNSGGPVLNAKGEVVGVAVCGSGITDAPYTVHNGAIPMTEAHPFITGGIPIGAPLATASPD